MEAFAAESSGMPQLNPEFWISQIFWLTITFGILYVVLSKLLLPKISDNLEMRKSKILENIEAADKQREESQKKLDEYETLSILMIENFFFKSNFIKLLPIKPKPPVIIKFSFIF